MVYEWPGNVRELENALEHAAVLSRGNLIEAASLPERITKRRKEPLVAERSYRNPTLEVIERAYIMWVLQAEGGNKTRAAEVLGIDPSTLYRKLSRYEGAGRGEGLCPPAIPSKRRCASRASGRQDSSHTSPLATCWIAIHPSVALAPLCRASVGRPERGGAIRWCSLPLVAIRLACHGGAEYWHTCCPLRRPSTSPAR